MGTPDGVLEFSGEATGAGVVTLDGVEEGTWYIYDDCAFLSLDFGGTQYTLGYSGGQWLDSEYGLTPTNCSDVDCCEFDLTWSQELTSYNVQCDDLLPQSCEEFADNVVAVNECDGSEYDALCVQFSNDSFNPACSVAATTSKRNDGLDADEYDATDGAIRVYGLAALGGADSDFFVEDPTAPLTFTHAPGSGTARLVGRVYCRENDQQWFDIDAVFEGEQMASEWLAEDTNHSLMINDDPNQEGYQMCAVNEDEISVFTMSSPSIMTAGGDLNGFLRLEHMPVSLNKRFQLGEGANNHNCAYGFGGWFKWEGSVNGEAMSGLSGDIVVDLESCPSNDSFCQNSVSFNLRAFDEDCGRLKSDLFTVISEDTTSPTILEAPEDMTVECDNIPEMPGTDAISAEDNCGKPVTISEGSEISFPGSCPNETIIQRLWTVTDFCGNETIHAQIIIAVDTTNPELTIPDDYTASCEEEHPLDAATAMDNCGDVEITETTDTTYSCPNSYVVTRAFTAVDACGNDTTMTQTITIEDNTAPELMDAANQTVECDGMGNVMALENWLSSNGGATAMDNCGAVTWYNNYECTVAEGDFLTYNQQSMGDDESSEGSDYLDANFGDVFPNGVTVGCVDGFELLFTTADAVDTYLPCSGSAQDLVLTHGGTNPTVAAQDPTCWDNALVSHLLTAKINVAFDLANPDMGASEYPASALILNEQSLEGYSVAEIIAIGDDVLGGCSSAFTPNQVRKALRTYNRNFDNGVNLGLFDLPGCANSLSLSDECGSTGEVTVTFLAIDECGNEAETSATFTIEDTTAPDLVIPADYTAECDANHPLEAATATDICGSVTISEMADTTFSCANSYVVTRTFTATDDCGNDTTMTQTITIQDTTAPELMIPADYTAECDADHPLDDASATDNCGMVMISESADTSYTCANGYVVTRTFTATDGCGNQTAQTQTITIQDTTAPELTIPADYTAECSDAHPLEDASAMDNCGMVDIAVQSDTLYSCANSYIVSRTFTASDACGNMTSRTQTITIQDTTEPEFLSVPDDYSAECSADHPLEDATASDNCGSVNVTVDADTTLGECAGAYVVVRTFTATDACGNSKMASQTVTIVDTTAPVFDAYESSVAVECTDGDGDDVNYLPLTASDNCGDVNYSVTSTCMSGGCSWTIMRIWTATDDCGNSTTAEQYLTLVDTTAPEVTAPPAYVVAADASCEGDISVEAAGMPIYSDNCGAEDCWGMSSLTVWSEDGPWTPTCEADDENAEGTKSLERTWYVQDRCGNIGEAIQWITVKDETAPEGTVEDASVACALYDANTAYGSTSQTDNCDSDLAVSWEESAIVNVEGAGCYQVERTYTWTDDCGNSSSAIQTITVFDNVPPEATGENEVVIDCANYPDNNIYIEATDDCGETSITFVDTPVSGGCVQPYGMYRRAYTIVDECDNASEFIQYIRLQDNTAPELTIPADYTVECDQEITLDEATATDVCDSDVAITLETEEVAGDCPNSYQIKRTFTAKDDCDNAVSLTQTITVVDTTAPELVIPADYTAECSDAHPLEEATATDNCGEVNIEVSTDTLFGLGAIGTLDAAGAMIFYDKGFESDGWRYISVSMTDNHPSTSYMGCYCTEIEGADGQIGSGMKNTLAWADAGCSDFANYALEYESNGFDQWAIPSIGEVVAVYENLHLTGLMTLGEWSYVSSTPSGYGSCGIDGGQSQIEMATGNVFSYYRLGSAGSGAMRYVRYVPESEVSTPVVCPQNYTVSRTFTATDDCGNSTSATQTITIQDTTAPDLTIAEDMTVNAVTSIFEGPPWPRTTVKRSQWCRQTSIAGACPDSYAILVPGRLLMVAAMKPSTTKPSWFRTLRHLN